MIQSPATITLLLCWLSTKHNLIDLAKKAVAKMASHAIFQYNVLAIDDTHNICTNMIVKMNIPMLLGSSDDKEKIGVARPEWPPLRWFSGQRPETSSAQRTRIEETVKKSKSKRSKRDNLLSPVEPTIGKFYSPVQQTQRRPNQQSTPVEPTLVSEASVQLSRDSIFRGGF